jgi:hypothetical protein
LVYHPGSDKGENSMAGAKRIPSGIPTGWDVLQNEILGEQAATIGRLGQELRTSLDALAAFDRDTPSADRRDPQRMRLVDAAGYALWHFVVQRDCAGLRGTEHVLKQYGVPAEVRARMGVSKPR